jgi:hypothetical protein
MGAMAFGNASPYDPGKGVQRCDLSSGLNNKIRLGLTLRATHS